MTAAPARIAVVGCGWWSTEAHLPALVAHPDAEATAVADPDPERRRLAAERFGVRHTFADVDELLAAVELDGAIVGTGPMLHHPLAARLLDAGVHVLVEKPMTIEPADAHDLVERAQRRGVELLVGYAWHYNAHVQAAREAIAAERIGQVELVGCLYASIARELFHGRPERYAEALGYTHLTPGADTYNDRLGGGGQGGAQLTHALGMLLRFTGLEPVEVAAFTAGFELDVDLADALSVRFGSGALAALGSAGNVLPRHEEVLEYRILGSAGHIMLDVGQGTLAIHDADGIERLPALALPDRYPTAGPVDNLVAIVHGTAENRAPGTLGARVVELLAAMHRSQAEGRAISLRAADPDAETSSTPAAPDASPATT